MAWTIPPFDVAQEFTIKGRTNDLRGTLLQRLGRKIRHSLAKRLTRALGMRFIVARRMGALFLLDSLNLVDREMLVGLGWEVRQLACMKALAQQYRKGGKPAVFLDIGAHGALYSILLAMHLDFDRLVAFEPSPSNLVQLRANLLMNGLAERVEVIAKAAGENAGRLKFIEAYERNRGASRLVDEASPMTGARSVISVDVSRVDAEVQIKNSFIVSKIDVEGAELGVVRGMSGLFAENDIVLQVESNDRLFDALVSELAKHGFRFLGAIREDRYFTNIPA